MLSLIGERIRQVATLLAALGVVVAVGACSNTMEGAAEDIEQMGDEAEEATQ